MKLWKYYSVVFVVLVMVFALVAISQEATEKAPENTQREGLTVKEFLQKFKEDPKSVINLLPGKDYSNAIAYIELRNQLGGIWANLQEMSHEASTWSRNQIAGDPSALNSGGRRPWEGNDQPQDLLGTTKFEKNIAKLPRSAQVKNIPWSSDYWALKFGSSSVRYGEGQVYSGWMDFFNSYVQPREYLNLRGPVADPKLVDHYSPAEKYDVLVGDPNFTLTTGLKLEGAQYLSDVKFKRDGDGRIVGVTSVEGEVEHWMGICHGWAAAAYKVPRPKNGVSITGANGDKVLFHVDDLKSLAVLKWAHSRSQSRFVGGRCNIKADKVKTDSETGAVVDEDCFDTNPATWHLIAANKLSKGESFVIDATYDYEVWNQPVVGYELIYFNPKTLETTENLEEALQPYGFSGDKFGKLREKYWKQKQSESGIAFRPASLVGIAMRLSYVVETRPQHRESRPDQIVTADYIYDLELDRRGEVVGGEWYQNKHPDFIWDPVSSKTPTNSVDEYLSKNGIQFNGTRESLKKILDVGLESNGVTLNAAQLSSSSSRDSQGLGDQSPLATVIDYLIGQAAR